MMRCHVAKSEVKCMTYNIAGITLHMILVNYVVI